MLVAVVWEGVSLPVTFRSHFLFLYKANRHPCLRTAQRQMEAHARRGGAIISDAVTAESLRCYSVSLKRKLVDTLVTEERTEEETTRLGSADPEDLLTAVQSENEKCSEVVTSLLIGTLHTLHCEQMRREYGRQANMIMDDGTHTCSSKCHLRAVHGKAYFFRKDRVHVCIPGCRAPHTFHRGHVQDLTGLLWVCQSSGKAHICTPEACDHVHHEVDGSVVCKLTGKCLLDASLSHGWKEDNWRFIPCKPKKRKRGKDKASVKQGDTASAKYVSPAVVMSGSLDRAWVHRLARVPAAKETVATTAYRDSYVTAINTVVTFIRPLFPGHIERDALDCQCILRAMNRIITCWQKKSKQCLTEKVKLDFTQLRISSHHDDYLLQPRQLHIEPMCLQLLIRSHARLAVKYLVLLLKYTKLEQAEVTLADFVLAILYLQRATFKVADVIIIGTDAFLYHYLPPACHLNNFSHITSHNFTSTKTAIRAAIIEATERDGVPLSTLIYRPLRISDTIA